MELLLSLFLFLPKSQGIDVSFYQIPHGSKQKIILNLSIPHGKLLFEKKDTIFEAKYEINVDIKRKGKIILSDFWRFSEQVKDYEATQNRHLKTHKTVVVTAPNLPCEVRWSLIDLSSHSQLGDSTFSLNQKKFVSSLIPLDYSLYLRGKREILPLKVLDGKISPLIFYRIDDGVKTPVEAVFTLKRKENQKTVWVKERTLLGPVPIEDTLLLSIDTLYTGSYTLEGNFSIDGKNIRRTIEFSIFNLNRLIDRDFKMIVDIVSYIASPEEIKRFKKSKPIERHQLWNEFWKKRDPTPGTERNEVEEIFLERVQYANEHFSYGNWPGYRTDRGMIYIKLGPPDDIESHPFDVDAYPYEVWYYYTLNLQFLFVDKSGVGEYELVYPVDYRTHL